MSIGFVLTKRTEGINVTKAYSYVRMSTEKQSQGDSLRRQTERAEQFCREHGLDLDTDFKLHDIGFSAFRGDHIANGSLGRFLEAVRAKQIAAGSYLIIESHDRLSRMEPRRALPVFLDILNAGISVAVLSENRIFRPDSTNQYELLEVLVGMVRSHDESLRKSDRGKRTWEHKRTLMSRRILTRLAPGWLVPRPDRSGFDLDPARVEVVKLIFDLAYSSGMGSFAIARELNDRRISPFGRGQNGWQKSSVEKILKNRAVIGEYEPHRKSEAARIPTGQVVQGYFPPVIDPSLFLAVRHKRTEKSVGGGGRIGHAVGNLFTKIARCGYCHGPMHLVDKGPRSGGKYLVCDSARRRRGCRVAAWPYRDFETSFFAFVTEIDLRSMSGEFIHSDDLARLRFDLEAANGRLAEVMTRRQKIFDLLTGPLATDFVADQLAAADRLVSETQDQIAGLERQTQELRAENTAFAQAGHVIIDLLSANDTGAAAGKAFRLRLRAAIRDVVDEICLYPLGNLAPKSPPPWAEPDQKMEQGIDTVDPDLPVARCNFGAGARRNRWFKVRFKDGNLRRLKPSFADPTKFDWIGDADDDPITRRQVEEMATGWGLDPSVPAEFDEAFTRLREMSRENATLEARDEAATRERQQP